MLTFAVGKNITSWFSFTTYIKRKAVINLTRLKSLKKANEYRNITA